MGSQGRLLGDLSLQGHSRHSFLPIARMENLPNAILSHILNRGFLFQLCMPIKDRFGGFGGVNKALNALAYSLPLRAVILYKKPFHIANIIAECEDIISNSEMSEDEAISLVVSRVRGFLLDSPILQRVPRETVEWIDIDKLPWFLIPVINEVFPGALSIDCLKLTWTALPSSKGVPKVPSTLSPKADFSVFKALERLWYTSLDYKDVILPRSSLKEFRVSISNQNFDEATPLGEEIGRCEKLKTLRLSFPIKLSRLANSLAKLDFLFLNDFISNEISTFSSRKLRKLVMDFEPSSGEKAAQFPDLNHYSVKLDNLKLVNCEDVPTDKVKDLKLSKLSLYNPRSNDVLEAFADQESIVRLHIMDTEGFKFNYYNIRTISNFTELIDFATNVPLPAFRETKLLFPTFANLHIVNLTFPDSGYNSNNITEIIESFDSINLERLTFCNCDLDVEHVEKISKFQNLVELKLSQGGTFPPDDEWISPLTQISTLDKLNLTFEQKRSKKRGSVSIAKLAEVLNANLGLSTVWLTYITESGTETDKEQLKSLLHERIRYMLTTVFY